MRLRQLCHPPRKDAVWRSAATVMRDPHRFSERARITMELHHLEYFIELSKFQNVSLTAEHLNISQPALSKTISQLEAELGVKLFDRVGRRIRLNDHGRLFARYAEQTLETLKEGTRNVQNLEVQPSGTICLGLYSYIDLIAGCIRGFMEKYPLVRFEIYSSKSQYTIDNFENLDFALTSSLSSSPASRSEFLESIRVTEEEYVLAVSPALLRKYLPDRTGPDWRLGDFAPVPFLGMADNLMFSDVTGTLCQQAGFTPNMSILTNDYATKLHMVSMGNAASFIPEACIPVFRSYCPELLFLHLTDISGKRIIRLSRRRRSLAKPVCDTFWEYAGEYFSPLI